MEATPESAEPRASGVDSQFNQAPKKSAPAGTFARADSMDSHATRSVDFVCGHSLPLDFVWFELTRPSEFDWLESTDPLDFVRLKSTDDVERRLVGTPSSESACNECPQMEATPESAEPRASGVDSRVNQAPKKSAPAGT